jgi:hypothetical protein
MIQIHFDRSGYICDLDTKDYKSMASTHSHLFTFQRKIKFIFFRKVSYKDVQYSSIQNSKKRSQRQNEQQHRFILTKENWKPHGWLMPVILPTPEEEIRRITVQSQPGQIVCMIPSVKYPKQSMAGVTQGAGP